MNPNKRNLAFGLGEKCGMDENRFKHYRLNIKEIDDEHWNLFQMLDHFEQNVRNKERIAAVSILTQFTISIREHFRKEEDLMLQHNFPFRESHIDHHKKIEAKVTAILNAGFSYSWLLICYQLNSLLIDHIDWIDSQYADFINNLVENNK